MSMIFTGFFLPPHPDVSYHIEYILQMWKNDLGEKAERKCVNTEMPSSHPSTLAAATPSMLCAKQPLLTEWIWGKVCLIDSKTDFLLLLCLLWRCMSVWSLRRSSRTAATAKETWAAAVKSASRTTCVRTCVLGGVPLRKEVDRI